MCFYGSGVCGGRGGPPRSPPPRASERDSRLRRDGGAGLLLGADCGRSVSRLTGSQGGGRDLDLAGGLIGLEGRGSASGAEVGGEQVGALGARGAGAGPVAAVVGLLLLVHRHQLQEAERDMSDVGQRVNILGQRVNLPGQRRRRRSGRRQEAELPADDRPRDRERDKDTQRRR